MFWEQGKESKADIEQIHKFYMTIINSVPDAIYWIDANCNLIGCNTPFIELMGIKNIKELKGTPYDFMKTKAHWLDERIQSMRLDDMNAIFTGKSQHHLEERVIKNQKNNHFYFRSTRIPIFDDNKHVVGLIVVLSSISPNKHEEKSEKSEKTSKITKRDHLPTILMIEDNVIAQNVEKELLTTLNCLVDIADSGDEALKLFEPGKYDLVFMDIGLEDTSGYVVAKQIRNKEKDTKHHVPIIALTGFEAEVIKYDCNQYFMEGAITKPLTTTQAKQIIEHYIYLEDIPVEGLKHV